MICLGGRKTLAIEIPKIENSEFVVGHCHRERTHVIYSIKSNSRSPRARSHTKLPNAHPMRQSFVFVNSVQFLFHSHHDDNSIDAEMPGSNPTEFRIPCGIPGRFDADGPEPNMENGICKMF